MQILEDIRVRPSEKGILFPEVRIPQKRRRKGSVPGWRRLKA